MYEGMADFPILTLHLCGVAPHSLSDLQSPTSGTPAIAFAIWRGSPPKRFLACLGSPEKYLLIVGVVRNTCRESSLSTSFPAVAADWKPVGSSRNRIRTFPI